MNTVVFEPATIARYYGNSINDIIEIFDEYLASQDEMLQSLCTAFLSGSRSMSNCLHFHASIFTYVGFPQLTQDCIVLENECRSNISSSDLELKFNLLVKKIKKSNMLIKQEMSRLAPICYS